VNKRVLVLLAAGVLAAAVCLITPVLAQDANAQTNGVPSDAVNAADDQIAPPPTTVVEEDYRIAEEDVIRMDVWGEPQLTNMQMQVTPDGKINVAYLGSVQAAGLTIAELTDLIRDRFEEEQILFDPRIQLTILTIHQPTVRVLGQVNRPGIVVYKDGDKVIDAIAQAGSYTENAWLERVTLTHKDADQPITIDIKNILDGDLTQNFELQKGDTIYIPPEDYENKVYVLGQVLRPSLYDLKENTTVLAAISMAGGPTQRGSLNSTLVIRGDSGNPGKPIRLRCNLTQLFENADVTQDVVLRSGDVVFVPESNKPDWSKISQVLSTIMSVTYIRRYGLF